MAFGLISSFAFFRLPITVKNIPPSNRHPKRLNLHSKSLSEARIINPHDQLFLSFPLKHCNCATKSSTLNVGSSVETPFEVKILKHILRELVDSWETLNVIDAIQRLGIDCHFQEEIDAILRRHHALSASRVDHEKDLYKVALRFRLLRQQGYYVPADVFEIFMDKDGRFDEELREDINGLISLYEASQLCMKGEEDILEVAGSFARQILYARATNLDHHLARFVHNTLAHPHHKTLSTFMVKNYFGDTQWTNKWIGILQQVAKMDFNATQALRQKEIVRFLQWWKESGLAKESQFSRHQPLTWYTSSLAFCADPCFSEQRILLAKSISFVYLIDDIFDVYGTLDQLTLFTEAVCRWDMTATDQLPDYMKFCFGALYKITDEISYNVYQKHGYNPIESLRKAWAKLCKAFLVEAEWFKSGHSPKAQEYLKNGIVSSGVPMALEHFFFLLGQEIREETVELLDNHPAIVSSSAVMLRLLDDLQSAKEESQDGHDGSYVEYYMKERQGISFEATRKHVENMISDAWKTLNRECLSPYPFPAKFVQASLNIARMVPIVYNGREDESSRSLDNLIKSLFFQSVDAGDSDE